jgi:hypothetical protein
MSLHRIIEWFSKLGYIRARQHMMLLGNYEAVELFNREIRILEEKSKFHNMARVRLMKVKKAKSNYEPSKHYMRGKTVAFWSGKVKDY